VSRFYDHIEVPEVVATVDASAHIGFFTIRAAIKAKKGEVVATEPHSENFRKLAANVRCQKHARFSRRQRLGSPKNRDGKYA